MSGERKPDHSDDPRDQSTGQGYPESGPAGSTPREGGQGAADETAGGPKAPQTATPQAGDAGQATGNPDAAG